MLFLGCESVRSVRHIIAETHRRGGLTETRRGAGQGADCRYFRGRRPYAGADRRWEGLWLGRRIRRSAGHGIYLPDESETKASGRSGFCGHRGEPRIQGQAERNKRWSIITNNNNNIQPRQYTPNRINHGKGQLLVCHQLHRSRVCMGLQ